ncbi:hypothetical protein GGR53DRAFT_99909 [Hypoxylon sp. FL1150]|nr:hypothetical protein GGR53DRAFT_99909 [Hypoxylon sp. FL1150]
MPPTLPPGVALGPTTPGRGRSVIATRAYDPGATIATFDGPTVAIPESSHLERACSHCLRVKPSSPSTGSSAAPRSIRACTKCRTAHYCSTACQKADWDLAHGRGECKAMRRARAFAAATLPADAPKYLPTTVRALVQVLVRPEMAAAVAEMEGHPEKQRGRESKVWFDIQLQARGSLHYVGREESEENIDEVAGIVCKLMVNSFTMRDTDLDESGLYTNAALAMINHSCVPNAFVDFVGRTAILHAKRAIKEGEEIEISYIENTNPRSQRQQALTQYHFTCACPRCKDNLDAYQICQRYPHLELNTFSIAPDLERLRNPFPYRHPALSKPFQKMADEIDASCSVSLVGTSMAERSKEIPRRWKACAQLRKAEAYAVDPLRRVFSEASVYFLELGNIKYSLALTCFTLLNSDPFRDPEPFAPQRLKDMFMVTKVLSLTATAPFPSSVGSGETAAFTASISEVLDGMKQITVCHTMLKIILHYGEMAHSKEWSLFQHASDLLTEVESLPGRETENVLVDAFTKNPNGQGEEYFFKTTVLEPLQKLAEFALEIMNAEFGT